MRRAILPGPIIRRCSTVPGQGAGMQVDGASVVGLQDVQRYDITVSETDEPVSRLPAIDDDLIATSADEFRQSQVGTEKPDSHAARLIATFRSMASAHSSVALPSFGPLK